MLIPDNYRRNPKTSNILLRERVNVCCDRCKKQWDVTYQVYSDKKLPKDYCRACKNTLGIAGRKEKIPKTQNTHIIYCDNCNQAFERYHQQTGKRNFCSTLCFTKYRYAQRFCSLLSNWREYTNEMAYLIGTILGDGHINKTSSLTSRVQIYCNASCESIKTLTHTLKTLKIQYTSHNHGSHCLVIQFSFPNKILKETGILYSGAKIEQQPKPTSTIIRNIHFAVGLINSDGYIFRRTKRKHNVINFSTITNSICESYIECLHEHSIFYTLKKGPAGKRMRFPRYDVYIYRAESIKRLYEQIKIKLKPEKAVK